MKLPTPSILALGVTLALCAVLTVRWAHARARSAQLDTEISRLRATIVDGRPAVATAEPDTTPQHALGPPAPAEPDIEARQRLLAEARAIPELARREATLVAIRRIKAHHAATPPPPRALPPPIGTRTGPYFTELFSDPGYLTLVREDWRSGRGASSARRLAALDLPEATRKQAEDVEFESFLGAAELGANAATVATMEERRALMQVRKEMDEERQTRLRQVLGEDHFRHYSGASPSTSAAALAASGSAVPLTADRLPARVAPPQQNSISPLATRLSYSSSPLTEADTARLQTLVDTMAATSKTPTYRIMYEVEFFQQAQSILNPTQLNALRQVQEEREARTLRSQLPKSSELPRTTRRTRLEGGG